MVAGGSLPSPPTPPQATMMQEASAVLAAASHLYVRVSIAGFLHEFLSSVTRSLRNSKHYWLWAV